MNDELTVRIETVDGNTHLFQLSLPRQGGVEYSAASKFEKFLNQQCIALHVNDEVIVFPMHQVRSIRFSPVESRGIKWIVPAVSHVECQAADLAASH